MAKRKCGITFILRNFITKIKNMGKKQTRFLSVITITQTKVEFSKSPSINAPIKMV